MGLLTIAYFSGTGTTEAVAEKLATELNADIYKIQAKEAFTVEELTTDPNRRALQEQYHPEWRPELAEQNANVAQYDIIFIGYPIWKNVVPRVVASFIESNNFSNKTIVPFCTAHTSGIENSIEELRGLYPDLKIEDGHKFSQETTQQDVAARVQELKQEGKLGK